MSSTVQQSVSSEPNYAKSEGQKTDYPWYLPSIEKYLRPDTRELLVQYSHVPYEQQSEHVHRIRDLLWNIRSYPCVGLGVFLEPMISRSPAYQDILQRLKAGGICLDIGCHIGGDLRRLVFDGAPSDNLYAVDIVDHWEIGYDLFRDKDRFSAHYLNADVLSLSSASGLQDLKGRVDVISIMAVFHQWTWEKQVEAAKQLVPFTKKGSLIVGFQIGNPTGQVRETPTPGGVVSQWRQGPDSFAKMWDQVGVETKTKWSTKAILHEWEEMGWDVNDMFWMEKEGRPLTYTVTRVE